MIEVFSGLRSRISIPVLYNHVIPPAKTNGEYCVRGYYYCSYVVPTRISLAVQSGSVLLFVWHWCCLL